MILEEDTNVEAEEFRGLTYEEQVKIAKDCMKDFFSKEQFCWGGPIPQHMILSASNVDMVLTTTIMDAVDRFYCKQGYPDKKVPSGMEHEFEKLKQKVLDTLNLCARRWMPKHLAGGIMLMYFSLCEGISC